MKQKSYTNNTTRGKSWFAMALLFVLTLVGAARPASATEKTLTVGTATSYTTYAPVMTSYNDTWTEMIYTADMLADLPAGSVIKKIGFSGVSAVNIQDMGYELYIKSTDASEAPSSRSDLADFTCLYNGSMTVSEAGSLSAPESVLMAGEGDGFTYEGGNLHVVVKAHIPQVPDGNINFAYQNKPKSILLSISNDQWANTLLQNNYQYLPVADMMVELPEGYVDLMKVTVGDGDAYDYSTPMSLYYDNHSMSSTLYTADMLGIPADMDIHQIAYFGAVTKTATTPVHLRIWMANTNQEDVPAEMPSLEAMTLVFDGEVTLDQLKGSVPSNFVELMRLKLDTAFRYTGGNLLVVVRADNESKQMVYFAADSNNPGKSINGYGDSEEMSSFKFYTGKFPKTSLFYAAPQNVAEPEISFVTNFGTDKQVTMLLTSRNGVRVDWGGSVKDYPFGGDLTLTHDLAGNEIKIWPMSQDDHITYFSCRNAGMTSISVNAPELTYLRLTDNLLESVDISKCPALETLILAGNKIFAFEAESSTLRDLNLSHNGLQQLIISECTALERLDVSINSLRYPIWLFWPNSPALNYLNVGFNQILDLDISTYPALKTLICNHNNLSALDLSSVPQLEVLRAGYNGLSALDVARCPGLKILDICGTQAGETRLNANTALEELNLQLTGISSVNVSANTALRTLVLSQNALTSIDLSANKALEHLDIRKNEISKVDLSELTKLRFLDCSGNALAALDLSSNVALDSLYCSINNLTELPLPAENHIRFLDFASNAITSQPANIGAVKYLNCADNKWTSTDFTKTPDLLGLDIHSNLLGKDALNAMFTQLPDINGIEVPETDVNWMRVLNYNDNPGASEVSSDVPETKGWNCSYKADIRGDASAAIVIPADKVYTRISFGIDTKDETYYVDWGDGNKEEFKTTDPQYSYNSIIGYATGDIIRIYAPSTTELGVSNAGYLDLDVSGMPELARLSCSGNNFSSLDLSANTKLTSLNCRENPLTSISLPADCKLTDLDFSSTLMRDFNLAQTPLLIQLAVNSCRLESLDLTPVPSLQMLQADENSLQSVDLSGLSELRYLYLSKNQLTALDLKDNLELADLAVDFNKIETLDLSALELLETAHVNNNRLTSLTLDNPMMKVLLAGSNELDDIDLSKVPAVTVATVNDNNLTSLDLSENYAIVQIFAGDNKISNLKFAESMPTLKLVNVANNSLESIDLKPLSAITELVASGNRLSGNLDFTNNPALDYLNVRHNEIEGFKWGTKAVISTIYAAYNKIKTLNVPSDNLSVIELTRNELEAINLSRHTQLFYLVLDFNRLTSVNLSKNGNLWGVSLRANLLSAAAIDNICQQLPDINDLGVIPGEESWMKYLFLSGNPGCADADITPAIEKGWIVIDNEDIPVDRVLTLNVVDNDGAPVAGATLVLVVNGEDVGTQPVETQEGVYVYNPLPVFLNGVTYGVRVEKEGFKTQFVDINDIVEGDMTLTITLDGTSGVSTPGADRMRVAGGKGCVKVYLTKAADVVVYDISGRPVFSGSLQAGENIIPSLAPGIYITLGAKVKVY